MTRRAEVMVLLPATLRALCESTGLSRGNLSRVLADMRAADLIHSTGGRRKYVYLAGPAPRAPAASSVFDLGRQHG